ncbi:MAG TPA: TetR/AcrR family transcriptional regulator [Longimicrobiaceae bacterium]|nr:TetR/AcrR family transcriptional regulator [Longimicrobiaceae bacterium]
MRNGEQTRENIVRQAAGLFNRQGFAGASMSDIMAATGLQKGGIYRHFESKEALALEAFDYAVDAMGGRFAAAMAERAHAVDRLHAIVGVFAHIPEDPPVPGGCPMMNAMIDSDDGNPQLRDRARRAMDGLRGLIARTVAEGTARGEVRPGTDGDALATVLLATMEGAVALSQAYGDPAHVRRAREHLERYLDGSVRA